MKNGFVCKPVVFQIMELDRMYRFAVENYDIDSYRYKDFEEFKHHIMHGFATRTDGKVILKEGINVLMEIQGKLIETKAYHHHV